MRDLALVTCLFDYPENFTPRFYKKAITFLEKDDIHIVRSNNLIQTDSYYYKLYYYKIVDLLKYIKTNILGKYEYILFLDGTDTAFVKPIYNIIENFKKLNCSILFCAEKGLWPETEYIDLYKNKKILGDFKYLNSGAYIGYTDKIVDCLTNIIEKFNHLSVDDQGHWTAEYLTTENILIDYNCEFFYSTFSSKEKITIHPNNEYTLTVDAYIVHDNGPYNDETIKLSEYYE